MTAADRELIRLTASVFIERFKKWPDGPGEEKQHVKDAAKIARMIMAETYEKDQSAKLRNLEKDLEAAQNAVSQLQGLRKIAEQIIDRIESPSLYSMTQVYKTKSIDVRRVF